MMKVMLKLSKADEIAALGEKVKVHVGIVHAKQAIMIPAGYITAWTPEGGGDVVGTKLNFLAKSNTALAKLNVLERLIASTTLTGFVDFLSVNK